MMLEKIGLSEMKKIVRSFYPRGEDGGIELMAATIIHSLSPALEPLLKDYLENGEENNYLYKSLSIDMIKRIRHCCYLEAILMLDLYMKDEETGKMLLR